MPDAMVQSSRLERVGSVCSQQVAACSNPKSSRLEIAEQIPASRQAGLVTPKGALAPFAKCAAEQIPRDALLARDADARRIVSSRLEIDRLGSNLGM
jgi:hypothetical protein